jgi:hypothetical protein
MFERGIREYLEKLILSLSQSSALKNCRVIFLIANLIHANAGY